MPKIFHISGSINYGSPGHIVEQLGLLAQKNGYECIVAHSTRNMNPSQLSHYAMTTKWQEMVHAAGAKFLDLHGLLSTRETKALVQRIKEYKPDIIHLHNIHGYFCNYKVLFEYLDTIDNPVVWTMHDCWPFTGRCFHFVGVDCYKWQTGCYDCKAEPGYTVSKYCDRSKSSYELKKRLFSSVKNMTMVPVSDWQAAFLKDSFLKNCKVQTIHNGIDLEKFKPMDGSRIRQKYGITDKYLLLGVAAQWSRRKGFDDILSLRNKLSDKYTLVLIGLSQEQIKSLPSGIIGITRTESQQELAEYYSMADCFVNLTYQDTFPTVNLESLACGTPVITYRTGGSPEAVDENTGAVVEQGNLDEMCNKILEFKNTGFKQLHSSACRKRAEECFDKDKCFEKYVELYGNLLG